MLPVSRLTSHVSMPSSADTHFSTRVEQAEQVMPVTANFSFFIIKCLLFHQFFKRLAELIHNLIISVTNIICNAGLNMLGEQRLIKCI